MGGACRRRFREATEGALSIVTLADIAIRRVTHDDLPAVNRVYNWHIVESQVSFDFEPWVDAVTTLVERKPTNDRATSGER